jgi:hypothetical protein
MIEGLYSFKLPQPLALFSGLITKKGVKLSKMKVLEKQRICG